MHLSSIAAMKHRIELRSPLRKCDRVVIFPTLGHLDESRREWVVPVHGDVFSEKQISLGKRVLLKLLQRTMRVPEEAFQTPLFRKRIERFLAVDEWGRWIDVHVGDEAFRLAKSTRRNGHFLGIVRISAERATQLAVPTAGAPKLPLSIGGCTDGGASGHAYLLAPRGVSVISDIDDTLKHSHVACKRTLLANTFLRPFETIPGMAGVFRAWAEQGAAIHYVSSSPWQLYQQLHEHLEGEGFPAGSFHLRAFRLRDHLLRRVLMLRRGGKASVIRAIIRTFPARQFLLVGDSGERDPEIYGYMGRKFPQQVAGIYIRRLDGPRCTMERFAKAFRYLPDGLVRLYRDAAELADVRLAT